MTAARAEITGKKIATGDSSAEFRDAYSVTEFCARHGISRSLLYNMWQAGAGPRAMKVGTRTMISREAAADWRREREAAASPEAA